MQTIIVARSATSESSLSLVAQDLVDTYNQLGVLKPSSATYFSDWTALNAKLNAANIQYDASVPSIDPDVVAYGLMATYLQVTVNVDSNNKVSCLFQHEALKIRYTLDCSGVLAASGNAADTVYLMQEDGLITPVLQSELARTYKGLVNPTLQNSYETLESNKTLFATVGITADTLGIQTFYPVFIDDALIPNVQNPLYANRTSGATLADYIPALNAQLQTVDAKFQMLDQVSIFDSVATLEKQVDLLSSLVVALVQANPPSWLADYVKQVEAYSNLVGIDAEALLPEISKTKSQLRTLQTAYTQKVNSIKAT